MSFILKLIRELNSADNEKFISLALILGLVSGFLPFFNIFTLIILFFAFLLRIPFGFYLASWGVFSVVGYFLDPLFAHTGYFILTSKTLSPLWETVYNLPLMRWSGFNNTVVMGALTWGIVVGVILYFVLGKSIKIYRDKVFGFFGRYRFLKWIIPAEIKKKGIIRISGVISFVILFGGLFLFISLTFDPVMKKITEYSLSKLLKKPVKIESFKTSFFNADMNIKNMYIGNVKTDNINIKFSWKYLVWKKFDIKTLKVENIHTQKTLKHVLAAYSETSKTKNTEKTVSKFNFKLTIPDPKELIEGYKLESLEKIKKLKGDYDNFVKYTKNLKIIINKDKKKINSIKSEIDNLSRLSKKIHSLDDIQKIVSKTDKIKKEINLIQKDVNDKKTKLTFMKKQILQDLKEVKLAGKDDYARLSKKYELLRNGEYFKFAQSFLKPQIQEYVNKAMKYYKFIKPYLSKKEEKKYIRSKGMYITYTDTVKYPGFVLEKSEISAAFKDAKFKIKAYDISSDQTLYNKRGRILIDSSAEFYKKSELKITYLNDIKTSYTLQKLYLNTLKYKKFVFSDVVLNAGGNGIIKENAINLNSTVQLMPKRIDYKASRKISKILKNIKEITFNIKISGKLNDYKINIKSNIDKIFSDIMKKEIKKQIEAKKSELKILLNKKIEHEIKQTGLDLNGFDVINNLNSLDNSLKNIDSLLKKYSKEALKKEFLKKGIGNFINF